MTSTLAITTHGGSQRFDIPNVRPDTAARIAYGVASNDQGRLTVDIGGIVVADVAFADVTRLEIVPARQMEERPS